MVNKEKLETEIADEWEHTYIEADVSKLPWEAFKPPLRLVQLIEMNKIQKGKAIDLGCGLGTNAIYLAQKGFDVTAIDVSKTALKYASKRAAEAGVNIKFIKGFAHKLDFPEGSFTLAFDRGCFHHVPPELREDYIDSVHKILVKHGGLYLECFSTKSEHDYGYRFTMDDVKTIFGEKFMVIKIEEIKNTSPEGGDLYINSVFMEKR